MPTSAATYEPPGGAGFREQNNTITTSKWKFNFLAMAIALKAKNNAYNRIPRIQIPEPEGSFTLFPKLPIELRLRIWKFIPSPGHGMTRVNIAGRLGSENDVKKDVQEDINTEEIVFSLYLGDSSSRRAGSRSKILYCLRSAKNREERSLWSSQKI